MSSDKVPSTQVSGILTIPSAPTDSSELLGPDIGQNIGPISSIFNNAIWRSSDPDQNAVSIGHTDGVKLTSMSSKLRTKRTRTRETLLSHLPAPALLGDILDATASWWHGWRPLAHSTPAKKFDSLQEFVLWALNSKDPSIVGLGILCISVSIQQLGTDENETILCQLPHPPGVLVHEYFTRVEALIVNDTYYASTMEGISVILMSAKTLMNLGFIKKTWILYHRAISHCQLLGLHRPSRLHEGETDREINQRHSSWVSICGAEIYLSLLLGLPYAADCRNIPSSFYSKLGTIALFSRELLRLSVQVIDRNQMGLSGSTNLAKSIQIEIETSARTMPQEYWECDVALAEDRITKSEYFELITSQLWYHQLQVSLHMPLMIQSVENAELEPHRLACLESARGLLKAYRIMRLDPNASFNMVKIIDYQAFICAALLLLGVLGYGALPSVNQSIQHARDQDLVDVIVGILRKASKTSNNIVALQALQGLEALSALPRIKGCPPTLNDRGHCVTHFMKIVVPYSGVIMISAGEFLQDQRRLEESAQQPIMNPLPVFTLSHGMFESFQSRNQSPIADAPSGSEFRDNTTDVIQNENDEVPSVSFDFDWDGMMDIQAETDWAWLNDVKSGIVESL
ncbi:Dehydrocurvularin biosynthesis regulator [Hyphodiscus hymeniophilus]|uniref:Dehydrocurvularin biosynthesis regulator n=1 Tax=Hyphodiscus hymeniophilus TaxID=353542 RepID=A0A9P6VFU1_9HELO|nr:Dehydrocurvularin biosynthesis regulator [Hyphodiscus hymeniophilus]